MCVCVCVGGRGGGGGGRVRRSQTKAMVPAISQDRVSTNHSRSPVYLCANNTALTTAIQSKLLRQNCVIKVRISSEILNEENGGRKERRGGEG